MKPEEIAAELTRTLKDRPSMFAELLREYGQLHYRVFLRGWSELRTRQRLERDPEGRYFISSSNDETESG